jgi:hypothetical protein
LVGGIKLGKFWWPSENHSMWLKNAKLLPVFCKLQPGSFFYRYIFLQILFKKTFHLPQSTKFKLKFSSSFLMNKSIPNTKLKIVLTSIKIQEKIVKMSTWDWQNLHLIMYAMLTERISKFLGKHELFFVKVRLSEVED